MNHATLHGYNIHFDELVPEKTIHMRKATFEALTGTSVVDPTLPVRGEPGLIPRPGKPVVAEKPAPAFDVDPDPEAGARMARGEYFGSFDGHKQKWFKADGTLADSENPATEPCEDAELPIKFAMDGGAKRLWDHGEDAELHPQ